MLIYNDAHIQTFKTGIDHPPLCIPKQKMDMQNDIFKLKPSEGGICIYELEIAESKILVDGNNQFWLGPDSENGSKINFYSEKNFHLQIKQFRPI